MKPLEQKVFKYLKARGWDKLRPADVAKSIMIEGAELLELFQWENKTLEEVLKNKNKMQEVQKELADIFLYALILSVSLKLNTEKIITTKLARVEKKYPAKLMRKINGEEPGANSAYWKIKMAYRKNKK